jgi:hypothetical protein
MVRVYVTCHVPWHSRWPGIRLKAWVSSVDYERPPQLLRRQRFRLDERVELRFPVYAGETLSFALDSVTSAVPDVFGPIDFKVPAVAADEVLDISLHKPGFVVTYGRFRGTATVRPPEPEPEPESASSASGSEGQAST